MMANKPMRRDSVLPTAAASLLAPQAQTSPHEASGSSNEFHDYGAKELAAALEQKGVSALELAEHATKRIESLDPQINALIVRDFERARAAAIASDQALARGDRKPLLDIPMAVKQQYHVAGLPTTWPDTPLSRVEIMALLETLNAMLLSRPSATVTLEDWCRDRRLAVEPRIIAHRVPDADKPLTAEQREELAIGPDEPVRYRRVELACGARVLSVADNWYVPARLTPEMNHVLETTDTPFGRAVAALHFARRTLEARVLWSPLRPESETTRLSPPAGTPLKPPAEVLRHRAILSRADGVPFSEVVETYTGAMLDFAPP